VRILAKEQGSDSPCAILVRIAQTGTKKRGVVLESRCWLEPGRPKRSMDCPFRFGGRDEVIEATPRRSAG